MGPLLPSFQDALLSRLKDQGLLPMTTGITKALPQADSYDAAMSLATGQINLAGQQFGARSADRYSLDIGNSYRDQRYAFLVGHEGVATKVYKDTDGSPTIGLGWHMNNDGARETWASAFGKDGPSFDAVKAGKQSLTSAQVRTLFDHAALPYEKMVDSAASGRTITQAQRVALFSVAWNAPTRFRENVAPLVQAGDDNAVSDAILTKTFSAKMGDALKARRYSEATLYTSSADAANVMPTFQAYNAAVAVDKKTGVASLRAVGTADVSDLNPEFQTRLANMIADAPASMRDKLGVLSGYRSVSYQAGLFKDAVKKYGSVAEARKWVAPPGHSQHGNGLAADLAYNGDSLSKAPKDVVDWVHANAKNYGLTFPLSNENWHIEPVEARTTGKLLPLSKLAPIGDEKGPQNAPNPMPGRPAALDHAAAPTPMPGRPAALSQAPAALPRENPAASDPHVDTLAKHLFAQYLDQIPGEAPSKPALAPSGWGNGIWSLAAPKAPVQTKATTVVQHLDGTTSTPSMAGDAQLPADVTLDPKTGKFVKISKVPTAPPAWPAWVTAANARADGTVNAGGARINGSANPIAAPVPVKAVAAPIPVNRPANFYVTKSQAAAAQPGYGSKGYTNTNSYSGSNPSATTWNPQTGSWENN